MKAKSTKSLVVICRKAVSIIITILRTTFISGNYYMTLRTKSRENNDKS
ncbi:MAG: hypothetical protein WCI91_04005 [Candidatus Nomurabacteria bacterium]